MAPRTQGQVVSSSALRAGPSHPSWEWIPGGCESQPASSDGGPATLFCATGCRQRLSYSYQPDKPLGSGWTLDSNWEGICCLANGTWWLRLPRAKPNDFKANQPEQFHPVLCPQKRRTVNDIIFYEDVCTVQKVTFAGKKKLVKTGRPAPFLLC